MSSESALSAMRDAVALWQVGQATAADVIYAACDLLTAGVDGPMLRMLAALSVRDADYELAELIESAMLEMGLTYHQRGSDAAKEAALRAMASRVLSSDLTPSHLAWWAHDMFGHDTTGVAQTLAELDDVYHCLDVTDLTVEDVDARVIAEARRITSLT